MRRALLLMALLNLGCGSTLVQRYLLDRPGPPHQGAVRVIVNDDRAPTENPVALIHVIARGPDADLPHLIEAFRDEARRLGCAAVVQVRVARAVSTATAVGFAVRRADRLTAPTPRRDAPWSPPPVLPAPGLPAPDFPAPAGPDPMPPGSIPAPWSGP